MQHSDRRALRAYEKPRLQRQSSLVGIAAVSKTISGKIAKDSIG